MKKYINKVINDLKNEYPNEKIALINGFIGIFKDDNLKHTTYFGNCYYEIDGIIYTDYNGNGKKVTTI